ncbi:hypothetical protein [Tepidibacter aestuarii]|uniref:hypothetical protein n=1 Tax=Tepidibacter aestuarii TaxID=2925782 RepID=UPI0020BE79CA|nr:hypothetical protein [Tepidibacter aestuarii]CAH2213176.1 protein of unknown function [Tepidibacter aestuarii]
MFNIVFFIFFVIIIFNIDAIKSDLKDIQKENKILIKENQELRKEIKNFIEK